MKSLQKNSLKILFKILRKLNKDEVSREEVRWALNKHKHTERIRQMMDYYSEGLTLWEVSDLLGVTRERVRQCVEKGVRQSWQTYNSSL